MIRRFIFVDAVAFSGRGKIRAEGANREYISDVASDSLKLIGSSQANFQLVRGR